MTHFRIIVLMSSFTAATLLTTHNALAQLIIANASVKENKITRTTLNSFLSLRRKNWLSGEYVTVFLLPEKHRTHLDLNKQILHTIPRNLRAEQQRRIYSGASNNINIVESEAEMIRRVSETPGSVGYTHSTFDPLKNIDIHNSDKLKIIEVVEF